MADAPPGPVRYWSPPGGRVEAGESAHRWWSVAELRSSEESFAPTALADALERLLAGPSSGPPRIVD